MDDLIAEVEKLKERADDLTARVSDLEQALAAADGDHFNPEARHQAFVERLREQGKMLPLRHR